MNARQKAKRYKKLYEEMKNLYTIHKIETVKTEYPVVRLRCCQIIPDDLPDEHERKMIEGINRFFYKEFEKKIIDFIKVVTEEDVMHGKRLTGELWVVDRRKNEF